MNFRDLNQVLLRLAPGILYEWYPSGKVIAGEFCIGDVAGNPGKSLRVSLESGAWIDHAATSDKGGDLISLYAACKGLGQGEAAKELTAKHTNGAMKASVMPPPPHAGIPSMFHMKHGAHGRPVAVFSYLNAKSEIMFYIARYDLPDGKEFCPWSWDGAKWIHKGWPEPRPLYGLEQLASNPEARVVIVEGEKACEALRTIAPDGYVVITWPGGSKAVNKADWTPTHGRKVLIWPDADTPGIESARVLSSRLGPNCPEVKVIDVTSVADAGWDAADAVASGWDWERVREWAKPLVHTYTIEAVPAPVINNILNVTEDVLDGPISAAALRIWQGLGVHINRQGNVSPSIDNMLKAIDGLREFKDFAWFDEFHMRYKTTWKSGNCKQTEIREWTDADDLELTLYFQRNLGLQRATVQIVNQALQVYANRHKRNEPKDWLSSLKWDRKERLHTFLVDAFGAPATEFVCQVSKNFWVSMIARVFRPGCKVDNMLVLEGSQGIYKSEALKQIGGHWFAEAFQDLHNKDFFLSLQGRLITEIGELDAFSRSDVTTIKRMLSCQVDRYRPPYGRAPADYPRQGVFVGSTNKDDWNRDDTGARRFWPVTVTRVNLEYIKDSREQCFAEAVERYLVGQAWWEVPKEEAETEQEKRRQTDPWEPIVDDYLVGKDIVVVNQILTECLQIEPGNLDKQMQMRVAGCLKLSGFKKQDGKLHGKKAKFWERVRGNVGTGGY